MRTLLRVVSNPSRQTIGSVVITVSAGRLRNTWPCYGAGCSRFTSTCIGYTTLSLSHSSPNSFPRRMISGNRTHMTAGRSCWRSAPAPHRTRPSWRPGRGRRIRATAHASSHIRALRTHFERELGRVSYRRAESGDDCRGAAPYETLLVV
jgi:hypothetical protein